MNARNSVEQRSTGSADRTVSADSVVVAAERQVSSLLGDETVILHLDQGVYYGLDPVGSSIWTLLQHPRTVREIRDCIVDEYEVSAERCEQELLGLLDELVGRGLVQVTEAASQ